MILVVDVGNSRTKYALVGPTRVRFIGAHETTADPGPWSAAHPPLSGLADRIEDVVVSSVVPAVNGTLSSSMRRVTGLDAVFVDHRFRLPFLLAVSEPGKLGVDRICAAAGAVRGRRESAIVIDVGSAVTVDLVDRGRYRGGLIMPGPGLGLGALGAFAARLPTIDYARLRNLFPPLFAGTRSSMILGVAMGTCGALERAVSELEKSAGRPLRTFLTGGGGSKLRPRLPTSWRYDPDLLNRGVYRIWRLRTDGESPS